MSEWERDEQTSPLRTLLGLGYGMLGLPCLHVLIFGGAYVVLTVVDELTRLPTQTAWNILFPMVLGIGLSQLLYVVPLLVLALLLRQRAAAAGLLLSACLTFLLNGACWGAFCVAYGA